MALRNYSTLFLVVFVVYAPLHFAVAARWQKALVTETVVDASDDLASGVHGGLDPGHVDAYRRARLAVLAAELLLIPLLVGATGRVLGRDESGAVPTVLDALRHAAGHPVSFPTSGAVPAIAIAVAVSAAVFVSLTATVQDLATLIGGATPPWPVVALSEATIRATAAPFFLGPAAHVAGMARDFPRG